MKKYSRFSRSSEQEITVNKTFRRNKKKATIGKWKLERQQIREAKIARDKEKQAEMKKHQLELAKKLNRETLCKKLLRRFEKLEWERQDKIELKSKEPLIDWSEIGKTWIFETDSEGNRVNLRRKPMKFTGEELLNAASEAIDEILSYEIDPENGEILDTVKIYLSFMGEVRELMDEEIARKIQIAKALERFFLTRRTTLESVGEERKAIMAEKRKISLTRHMKTEPSAKKTEVMETVEKLDKKFGRQILAGLGEVTVPDKLKSEAEKLKWTASKIKSGYSDLVMGD